MAANCAINTVAALSETLLDRAADIASAANNKYFRAHIVVLDAVLGCRIIHCD